MGGGAVPNPSLIEEEQAGGGGLPLPWQSAVGPPLRLGSISLASSLDCSAALGPWLHAQKSYTLKSRNASVVKPAGR